MPILIILLLVLFSFIFVFIVFCLTARYKHMMLVVCFSFITIGLLIYIAGYLPIGGGFADTLFATLRGIFSTARMFLTIDDYEALANVQGTQWLTENVWIKIILWLCYISALIIIQTALITLLGRTLVDNFRLRSRLHSNVYIIKGSDKNALLLGEDIATRNESKHRLYSDRLIVFMIGEDDDAKKTHEKTAHFSGVVQVLDRNHDFLYCLKKARLGKRNCPRKEKKYTIILSPKNESAPYDVRLPVEFAKRKGVSPDNLDIFVFTSSEWDREKIEEITQAKDGDQRKYPYTIHIVSEVDLFIRQMIKKHPPFECPGLNFSDGVAARDFTVMILGFGTMGQSALLRLVMNGQFVGSRMRAIIVDRNIDVLRDCFLHRYPGLKLCCDMEFKNLDVQCEKFFTLLNEKNNVDYIVIALCSDEINKQTALDIRLHYERKDHLLPFIAVSEKNGGLYEVKQDEKLFTFGCREDIYKESVIICEKADHMAKAVNDVYKEMYGGRPWHELDWFLQESNRATADFIPAMLKLAKLNEKDAINKKALTDDIFLSEILAQTEHLRWMAFHAAMGYLPISPEEMRKRFKKYTGEINSGECLNFSRRDLKSRLHACLAPWYKLDKVSEVYKELAHRAGNSKERKRDFKENDRKIIKDIPEFLKEAGKIST